MCPLFLKIRPSYLQAYGLWAWGNEEQQYYTSNKENLQVKDGKLLITARREKTTLEDGYTFNYTSARVITREKVGVFAGMTTKDGRKWDSIRIESSLKSPQPSKISVSSSSEQITKLPLLKSNSLGTLCFELPMI